MLILLMNIITEQTFYNFPPQYDYQTGSILLGERRRKIYRESQYFVNHLFYNSSDRLFESIAHYLENVRPAKESRYEMLSIFKDFVHESICLNHSEVFKYKFTKRLLDNIVKFYQDAYDKSIFEEIENYPFKNNIDRYCPINMYVLDSFIKYGSIDLAELVFYSYIKWNIFVVSRYKNQNFSSIVITYSLSLVAKLDDYLNKNDDSIKINENRIYAIKRFINEIFNSYHDMQYSINTENKNIINIINTQFSSFREFRTKDLNLDTSIIQTLDNIIAKTTWSETQ